MMTATTTSPAMVAAIAIQYIESSEHRREIPLGANGNLFGPNGVAERETAQR